MSTTIFLFFLFYLSRPWSRPASFSPRAKTQSPHFRMGPSPPTVSWPCVRGFSSTHLRMPARAAAGYCVSSFSSPHHVWKIYLSLPMRCPTLAYIHVAAKHVHTPLAMASMVLTLPATPCQPVETVNHPVNKPVSLSQASLLRSRQKVEKLYLHSRPVAGEKALELVTSRRGNVERRDGLKKQSPASICSEEKAHHIYLVTLRKADNPREVVSTKSADWPLGSLAYPSPYRILVGTSQHNRFK